MTKKTIWQNHPGPGTVLWSSGPAWLTCRCPDLLAAYGRIQTACCEQLVRGAILWTLNHVWALSGTVLAVSGQNHARESANYQQTWGSVLDPVPQPSCVCWVSQPRMKTFVFKKIPRQQPQNWSFSQRKSMEECETAWMNSAPQQPHVGLSPLHLPCFFPKWWVSRALTFPRNYLFRIRQW